MRRDRKSTRLNSSHVEISYAVFCLKKKKDDRVDGALYRRKNEQLETVAPGGGRLCRRFQWSRDHQRTRALHVFCGLFFFNDTATTEIYTLSLHDALPI